MAGSLNRVMLIGHLGADPEVRNFPNGGKVVNLRLATSETWKDKQSGEKKERTEWHTVAIFAEGLAGVAEKYLRKGSKVYIEGQLTTRKWQDQPGADRYSTEVTLRPYSGQLLLLDARRDGDRGHDRSGQEPDGYSRFPAGQPSGGHGCGGLDDPEIPF